MITLVIHLMYYSQIEYASHPLFHGYYVQRAQCSPAIGTSPRQPCATGSMSGITVCAWAVRGRAHPVKRTPFMTRAESFVRVDHSAG